MFLKRFFISGLLLPLLGIVSCSSEQKTINSIVVRNESLIELQNKPVVVKRAAFPGTIDKNAYPLITTGTGDTIASQLDDLDGDGNWDELFFVLDLKPSSVDTLSVSWMNEPAKYVPRTNVRFGVRQDRVSTIRPTLSDTFYPDQLPGVIGYQHYQTDGPTWENDKVAFRSYLDGRNSVDVFGKTKPAMTPDSVGIGADGFTENNYSVMKDWGTDILGVANSVGIGGVSMMVGDSLARLGVTEQDSLGNVDTTIFKVLTSQSERSVIRFNYNNWRPAGREYDVQATTSIWPGMYAFKNSVSVTNLRGDEKLLVGLVNSNTTKSATEIMVNEEWVALLTYDQQSINKTWYLGMALILPRNVYDGFLEAPETGPLSTSFFAKLKMSNDVPVDYYAVAGWELSDPAFRDEKLFTKYVTDLAGQLNARISVSVR